MAKPGVDALLSQAIGLHQAGRSSEALAIYGQVLKLHPSQADALHLSGILLHQRGDSDAGVRRLQAALAVQPTATAIHFNLGLVLRHSDRREAAIASFRKAAALDPRFDAAHYELATALDESGRYEEALEGFTKAVALRPSAAAWFGVGNCLARLQRPEDATRAYRSALAMEPGNVDAAFNLALVLVSQGRSDEAASVAARLASLPGANAPVLDKAGQIRHSLGQLAAARDLFARALALDPANPQAGIGISQLDLLQGRFDRGWRGYEARWRAPDLRAAARYTDKPRWSGTEALAGKTLLVHAEQGFGDTLQFCRYLPLLAQRGARVVAQVQPELTALLRRSFEPSIRVVGDDEDPGAFDLHCPMLSLPLALDTRLQTVPCTVPYLVPSSPPGWLAELREPDMLLVGLAWSGNYRHANDINRSLPPRRLHAWLDALVGAPPPRLRFVALQTQFRPSDRDLLAAHPSLLQIASKIESFDDTAAAVGLCDLVVSADTSVVHLAGALGRPVWVLLPHVPDWRWMMERVDSPWYPTARLFRQERTGDWDGVLARVASQLAAWSTDTGR